jgi:hypothetical protein
LWFLLLLLLSLLLFFAYPRDYSLTAGLFETHSSTTYYFVDRVLLRMLVKATDDATKQIYVFFPPDKKIGIEVLRKYDRDKRVSGIDNFQPLHLCDFSFCASLPYPQLGQGYGRATSVA